MTRIRLLNVLCHLAGAVLAASACAQTPEPGDVFQDCSGCPEMIVIPPGHFIMGSPESEPLRDADESPRHTVTIAAPFAVSRFEVTRDQYAAFAAATGRSSGPDCTVWVGDKWELTAGKSWRDPHYPQTGTEPVACIDWADASAYADWLSQTTGYAYRLLSEAEWEYMARGGTTTVYHFGDDPQGLCAFDNGHDMTSMAAHPDMPWDGVPCDDGFAETAPVGTLHPNPFGVYDVHGNVWEWLADCYVPSYDNAPTDGSAVNAGACEQRVYRGGGWSVQERGRRAANRGRYTANQRYGQLGLRVARDLP